MTERLYVMWRTDGEFNLTDLDPIHQNLDTNELVKLCIQDPEMGLEESEIEEMIAMATDSDDPRFIGYEMPAIFVSSDVKFIQT